jgi:hypothetical protein
MNYEKKYLKYKNKYIQYVNNQIGGTLEEDEAREINAAFPGLSVYSTTVDEMHNIIYMCTILNLYKKEKFCLIEQTKIIRRLITYLTNYGPNIRSPAVVSIINDNYIFLLETLIVTINNSNPTISNEDFFFTPGATENITALLIFINENKKSEKYVNLTLKLINTIFDKMLMEDGVIYGAPGDTIFLFMIATIIYLTNNISFSKTKYSITKVKDYIKKLKSEKKLNIIVITQEYDKLKYRYTSKHLSDTFKGLNVQNLKIDELLHEYFE